MDRQMEDALRSSNVMQIKDAMRKVKLWADAPDNFAKMGCVLLVDRLIDMQHRSLASDYADGDDVEPSFCCRASYKSFVKQMPGWTPQA